MKFVRQDPYAVLHVAPDAPAEVVAAAHKALMKLYHPDTASARASTTHTAEINEAWDLLRDPQRRTEVDRVRPNPLADAQAEIRRYRGILASGAVRMPWGRHEGDALAQIPSDYLRWILDHADAADDDLRRDVGAVLEERGRR